MVTIMTLTSAKGNKARKWFDAHNIEYQNYLVRHQPLTPEVIHKLLLLSPMDLTICCATDDLCWKTDHY